MLQMLQNLQDVANVAETFKMLQKCDSFFPRFKEILRCCTRVQK